MRFMAALLAAATSMANQDVPEGAEDNCIATPYRPAQSGHDGEYQQASASTCCAAPSEEVIREVNGHN